MPKPALNSPAPGSASAAAKPAAIGAGTEPRPRAYLIDSSIYIFRSWHVSDPGVTDKLGRPVNAVLGFSDFLWQLIHQKQPGHIACAFDESQTNSYRRELFADYKANRAPAPQELKHQFRLCRDFCRAIGIADYGSDRYEADDLIGSLAHRLRRQGFAITVVSADKDLCQLIVGPEDRWWDFARGTVLDARGIEKRYGVRPQQIADMLALSGDKIDNIPGIPGIGHKMAATLLRKYPCIEDLLENMDRIAQMKFRGAARIQQLVQAHRERLPLNKRLTTIVTDVECGHCQLQWRGLDEAAYSRLLDLLPFSPPVRERWRRVGGPPAAT